MIFPAIRPDSSTDLLTNLKTAFTKQAGEGSDSINSYIESYVDRRDRQKQSINDNIQKAQEAAQKTQEQALKTQHEQDAQAEKERLELPGKVQQARNQAAASVAATSGVSTPGYAKVKLTKPVVAAPQPFSLTKKARWGRLRRLAALGPTQVEQFTQAGRPYAKPRYRPVSGGEIAERWLGAAGIPLGMDQLFSLAKGSEDRTPFAGTDMSTEGQLRKLVGLLNAGLGYGAARSRAHKQILYSSIPTKDLAVAGTSALFGLPERLERWVGAAEQAAANSGQEPTINISQEGGKTPWWMPALGIGAAGLGAAGLYAAGRGNRGDATTPTIINQSPQDMGSIKVHLPAPEKGMADTVVSLPIEEFGISQTQRRNLARDVRRRLRAGTESRTVRRGPRNADDADDEDDNQTEFPKAAAAAATTPAGPTLTPQGKALYQRQQASRNDTRTLMEKLPGIYGIARQYAALAGYDLPNFGTPQARMSSRIGPNPPQASNPYIQNNWGNALSKMRGQHQSNFVTGGQNPL